MPAVAHTGGVPVESGRGPQAEPSAGPESRPTDSGLPGGTRIAAGAFLSALLVAAGGTTVELLNGNDSLGLVPAALLLLWGTTLTVAAALVLPTWAGWRWPRRVLGVAAAATAGYAVYWLSYEQVETAGLLVALTVMALSTVAVAGAVAAEARRPA